MSDYYNDSARCPRLPTRDDFPQEERSAYDLMLDKWIRRFQAWSDADEGRKFVLRCFEALTLSPAVAVAVMDACVAVINREGNPGTISFADHEMIDQVLAIDSGYFALVGWHTQEAIDVGLRIGALEALADGREGDLTDDERHQVEFIRAVRDGTMNDSLWRRALQRLGTERGVVDYVTLILLLVFHHRYLWALGVAEMPHEDWRRMLTDFKDGKRDLSELAVRRQQY